MNGFLADHKRGPADPVLQTRIISNDPSISSRCEARCRQPIALACLIRPLASSFLGLILLGEAK